MTKITRNLKTGVVLAALISTGMAGGKMQSQDLWQFISEMSSSLKTLSVASLYKAPLTFKLTKQNEFINFYDAEAIKLADGTHITSIGLRLSKESDGMAPLLNFSPSGQCVTLDSVKQRYPKLALTDYPRGRSENEVTSYSAPADINGQKVTFSFTVKKPDCLNTIVISAD